MNLPLPDMEAESLNVTIRFSASLPDMLLSVPNPATSTTSALKQLIRARLPPDLSSRRIRLIYAGKSLLDSAILSSSLKLHSPASRSPSRTSTLPPDYTFASIPPIASSAKGKAPIRDPPSLSRIYVHCSIGDVVLSSEDLAEEACLAARNNASGQKGSQIPKAAGDDVASSTTTPIPRGFDRLLNAGFTPSEIQSLRSQFLAIQAHTRISADMPSPDSLRELEDHWLDNSNERAGVAGTGGGFVDDENQAGALDDMLWGTVMGFFWPVGCLWWLCREEGIWSRRRTVAVVMGVVVNASFGVIRWFY